MRTATKRYNFQKIAIQTLLFTLEFLWMFRIEFMQENTPNLFMTLCGYVFMCVLYVGRGRGSKIYLRYETGIELILKTIFMNIIVFFFLGSFQGVNVLNLIEKIILLTAGNILTIIGINVMGNVVLRWQLKEKEDILFIYGPQEESRFSVDSREGVWVPVSEGIDALMQKIELVNIVYLVDIPALERNHLLKICYEKEKSVFITTKLSDVLIRASGITQDGDVPVCYCARFGIKKESAFIKRTFDIICSSIALICLIPLFLIVAILIKLEDGGPVIYTQTRCTIKQREFKIYKFRSLKHHSSDSKVQLTLNDDERVTKVGKVIRYTKIDELPQLLNILKGDMSIVGPRPERPEMIEKAIQEVPEFVLRMKVKAGLTGYAQVRSYYNTEFLDKLKWDLMYIENYSLLLDVKIVIMTIFAVFKSNIRGEHRHSNIEDM